LFNVVSLDHAERVKQYRCTDNVAALILSGVIFMSNRTNWKYGTVRKIRALQPKIPTIMYHGAMTARSKMEILA
jgi:hypothetical protein